MEILHHHYKDQFKQQQAQVSPTSVGGTVSGMSSQNDSVEGSVSNVQVTDFHGVAGPFTLSSTNSNSLLSWTHNECLSLLACQLCHAKPGKQSSH